MSALSKFPTGKSVDQAKKDAKRLSKEKGIRLSDALNRIASENSMECPWNEAMHKLRILASFPQPEGKTFALTEGRPIGVLHGNSGSGKTHLATVWIDHHISGGGSALLLETEGFGLIHANNNRSDPTINRLYKLLEHSEDRFSYREISQFAELEAVLENLSSKTLVVFEGIWFYVLKDKRMLPLLKILEKKSLPSLFICDRKSDLATDDESAQLLSSLTNFYAKKYDRLSPAT